MCGSQQPWRLFRDGVCNVIVRRCRISVSSGGKAIVAGNDAAQLTWDIDIVVISCYWYMVIQSLCCTLFLP
jgi:hypothetical protein